MKWTGLKSLQTKSHQMFDYKDVYFLSSPFSVSDLVFSVFELLVPAKNECPDGRVIFLVN
jgi:hypothetical protein